jgi:hypothetical protein
MSIGLLGVFGLMLSALFAISQIESSYARFCIRPPLSFSLVSSFLSLILRPFECKCFVLKCGNLDKFEFCSFDGILLGYTPHGGSYRVFNLETNTVI